jgi:hypothetical protein
MIVFFLQVLVSWSDELVLDWEDMHTSCPHQFGSNIRKYENITSTKKASYNIELNSTHLFYFENYGYIDSEEKIIFRLETCSGNATFFVRRTRPCWPDPFSGEWAQYRADSDDSVKMLEVDAESTKWFISVFGVSYSQYSLLVVPEASTYPRQRQRSILAKQISRDSAQITWIPSIAGSNRTITKYAVFSSALLSRKRVFTTVCGLQLNPEEQLAVHTCEESDVCIANVSSLTNGRTYFFNIIATGDVEAAYSAVILNTYWDDTRISYLDDVFFVCVAVVASMVVVLVTTFFMLRRMYS